MSINTFVALYLTHSRNIYGVDSVYSKSRNRLLVVIGKMRLKPRLKANVINHLIVGGLVGSLLSASLRDPVFIKFRPISYSCIQYWRDNFIMAPMTTKNSPLLFTDSSNWKN
jgi:hypothetical protein